MAPPVAAGFSSTKLHAVPVQVPSAKLTTRVLSVPIAFSVATIAPPLDVLKLCIDDPLCVT